MIVFLELLVSAAGFTAGCIVTRTITQLQPTECPNCAVENAEFQALMEISATTQQAHDQMMRAAQAATAHDYQAAHRAAPRF
jgi:hypothetical protein